MKTAKQAFLEVLDKVRREKEFETLFRHTPTFARSLFNKGFSAGADWALVEMKKEIKGK